METEIPAPRFSPDGRSIAYTLIDPRADASTVVVNVESGCTTLRVRRNGAGTNAWSSDGSTIYLQAPEFKGRYRIYTDLYTLEVASGAERRLTKGARIGQHDLAPDGRTFVAVQVGEGSNRLVLFDAESRELTPLTEFADSVNWMRPRWSPDGRFMAVGRWVHGEILDLVVLNAEGDLIRKRTYLGRFDLPETEARYHRLIAEWKAGQQQTPTNNHEITIDELVARFWIHAKTYYRRPDGSHTNEVEQFKLAMRPLCALYGSLLVGEFGPLALKAVRLHMIEAGGCRTYINRHVNRIRHVFKWGVGEELVSPSILHGLQAVAGLKRGRCEARESEPVPSRSPEARRGCAEACRPSGQGTDRPPAPHRRTGWRVGHAAAGGLHRHRRVGLDRSARGAQDRPSRPRAFDLLRPKGAGGSHPVPGGPSSGQVPVLTGRGGRGATGRVARQAQDAALLR